jgi:hypothetical protein
MPKKSKKSKQAASPSTSKRTSKAAAAPTSAAAAVSAALTHLVAARAALESFGLVMLTTTQRKESNGKLRDGEFTAMGNVLDTVDAYPGLFGSLADKDGGVDDALVETAPARADIAAWTALAPLAEQMEAVHTAVADTMLAMAESAKELTVPAYAIIRANASSNPKLAKTAAIATKFYGQFARQRAANQAKAAKSAKAKAPTT